MRTLTPVLYTLEHRPHICFCILKGCQVTRTMFPEAQDETRPAWQHGNTRKIRPPEAPLTWILLSQQQSPTVGWGHYVPALC